MIIKSLTTFDDASNAHIVQINVEFTAVTDISNLINAIDALGNAPAAPVAAPRLQPVTQTPAPSSPFVDTPAPAAEEEAPKRTRRTKAEMEAARAAEAAAAAKTTTPDSDEEDEDGNEDEPTPAATIKVTDELKNATKLREVLGILVEKGIKTKAALTRECIALQSQVPVLGRIQELATRVPSAAELLGITD